MRLTRPQSILISVGVLALFFGGGVVLVQKERRPSFKPIDIAAGTGGESSPQASSGNLPLNPSDLQGIVPLVKAGGGEPAAISGPAGTSPFTLNQFQRSEVRNGRKIWEVKATQGQYFPGDAKAIVRNAELFVFAKDGDQVTLWADSGTLYLSGPSLQRAEVEGNVRVMQNEEVKITTEKALYDKEKGLVEIPGAVKIEGAAFEISGSAMFVDVESRVVRLTKDVVTVISPAATRTAADSSLLGKAVANSVAGTDNSVGNSVGKSSDKGNSVKVGETE